MDLQQAMLTLNYVFKQRALQEQFPCSQTLRSSWSGAVLWEPDKDPKTLWPMPQSDVAHKPNSDGQSHPGQPLLQGVGGYVREEAAESGDGTVEGTHALIKEPLAQPAPVRLRISVRRAIAA